MACTHIDSAELRAPRPNQPVYREDCTQCFDSIDDPTGLDVCLLCFNGGCTGERNHSTVHHQRSGHPLVLNIRRTRKVVQRDEPPPKMSKLAIAADKEEDRYDTTTRVNCYSCRASNIDKSAGKLPAVVDGVMKALTFSRQEEVKAWEQEYAPCQHVQSLVQDQSSELKSKDLSQCASCDLKENLWLCLECGNLGCGRSQFGGVGGNSHGLAHADASSHGVAVKLGSITPEGSADVFCYKCNDEIIDPKLTEHLAHWGINIADREKTEQSLVEMQIEQNLKWDFSMTGQDGHESKPLFGSGLTGLKNLGNSCYISSVVQCLLSLPDFKERYTQSMTEPPLVSSPAEDLETQLRKLSDGLHSGRYSFPDPDAAGDTDAPNVVYQKGLAPAMFKHLVGRGHEEFSTMRQQDAFEFLMHLFKLITRSKHSDGLQDPVGSFQFALEQRLQCLSCKKVRYTVDEQDNISVPVPARRLESNNNATEGAGDQDSKPEFETVTLKECLDIFTGDEKVELTCPACGSKEGFLKRSRFKTFPKNLAVNARRFTLVNWVPTKLNIPVEVNDEPFDLGVYMSSGLQEGEELLPDDSRSQPSAFVPNQGALDQLLAMGFPEVRCKKALHATGNSDPEAAMNWLFSHMEDPDIDTPVELTTGNVASADQPMDDPDKIAQLNEMGIEAAKARKALRETDGDVMRAVDWVFSHPDDVDMADDSAGSTGGGARETPGSKGLPAEFQLQSIICHKGASVHAGHYVAFVRKLLPEMEAPHWVLFNDEKVAEAFDIDEMKKFAYVYFFRKL
ncbi:hypothetical protein AJ79_01392 [Helicocarpus griseus UAMH5409]|uniref:Ubiquitin carboxyl-terminal hydrolase n=1 Tax=Helicocarpus griseus UAMH5409 TaxID=1447875 RepID=A0A2B7Y7V7_9EURO|nr:hypothetical protein AJ79_01392 [Helicocarpus griseus UAMH5409]